MIESNNFPQNLGYTLLWLPFLLSICSCFSVKSKTGFEYHKLESKNYHTLLHDSANAYLIDVRTKKEFEKSHIENAVNYSFLKFHYKKDVKNLDRNKLVFLYCQTCHRSPLAARKMKRMGFRKVIDLKGGYSKWNASQ